MIFISIPNTLTRQESNDKMDSVTDWDIIVMGEASEEEIERHKKIYEDYPYMEAVKGEVVSFKNIFRLRDVENPIEDIFTRLENITI